MQAEILPLFLSEIDLAKKTKPKLLQELDEVGSFRNSTVLASSTARTVAQQKIVKTSIRRVRTRVKKNQAAAAKEATQTRNRKQKADHQLAVRSSAKQLQKRRQRELDATDRPWMAAKEKDSREERRKRRSSNCAFSPTADSAASAASNLPPEPDFSAIIDRHVRVTQCHGQASRRAAHTVLNWVGCPSE